MNSFTLSNGENSSQSAQNEQKNNTDFNVPIKSQKQIQKTNSNDFLNEKSNKNHSDIENDHSSSEFWSQEFNPALISFINSISQESHQEIENLNEIVQELKKMRNHSPSSNVKKTIYNDSSTFISQFNEKFNVSTSSLDEVLDIIEMIQTKDKITSKKTIKNGISQKSGKTNTPSNSSPLTTSTTTSQSNICKSQSNNSNNKRIQQNQKKYQNSQNEQKYQTYGNHKYNSATKPSKIANQNETPSSLSTNSPKYYSPSYTYTSYANNDSEQTLGDQNHDQSFSDSDFYLLKKKVNSLESEKMQLINDISNYNNQCNHLQQDNSKLKEKAEDLSRKLEKMQSNKGKTIEAFDGLEQLVKDQEKSYEKVMKQRDDLKTMLLKQNQICENLEKNIEQLQLEIAIEKLSNSGQKIDTSQFHNKQYVADKVFLDHFCHILTDNLPKGVSDEIQLMQNENSSLSIQSKIDNSIVCISKHLKTEKLDNESLQKEVSKLKEKLNNSQNHNNKIKLILEDTLCFLQKLTESADLQDIVFYNSNTNKSIALDAESKNEIIKKCINAHKFIDENIGFYSIEQTNDLFRSFEKVEACSIFSLYGTNEFEKKLRSLMSLFAPKNVEKNNKDQGNEFQVVFAMSIINDILLKHISMLQTQINYTLRQSEAYKNKYNEQTDLTTLFDEAKGQVSTFQEKEQKIMKKIMKIIPESENKSLANSIQILISKFKNQREEVRQNKETLSRKLKEVQNLHNNRLNKLKNKIKSMKLIITEQNEKIINNRSESISDESRVEIEMSPIKKMLSDIYRESEDIKKSIGLLSENYKIQLSQFRNEVSNHLIKNIQILQNSKQTSNKDQKIISRLANENETLKGKLNENCQNISEMKKKYQNSVSIFKKRINDLEKESNEVKTENAKLLSNNHEIRSQNSYLQTNIESLSASKRSLEVKLNSTIENFENEKRNIKSQLTAQITSLQTDFETKMKENQERRLEETKALFEVAMKHLNNEKMKLENSNSTIIIVKSLSALIDNLKIKQDQYFNVISDYCNAQQVLNLPSDSLISGKIVQIVNEQKETQIKITNFEKNSIILQNKISKLKCKNKNNQGKASIANQWDKWAKRIHGIACFSSVCTTFSPSQLQQSLEELILAQVQQRHLLYKVQILREEKKSFLKYPKSLLTEACSFPKPSFRAVIAVYFGIRRIQRMAGCIPIGIDIENKCVDPINSLISKKKIKRV